MIDNEIEKSVNYSFHILSETMNFGREFWESIF